MISKKKLANLKQTKTRTSKKISKKQRERQRLRDKSNSPGVPPNTCPYIDMTITMVNDLADAYERMRTRGEHNPMVDGIKQHAEDTLEYIRRANETLRDNSAYWYNKYKDRA